MSASGSTGCRTPAAAAAPGSGKVTRWTWCAAVHGRSARLPVDDRHHRAPDAGGQDLLLRACSMRSPGWSSAGRSTARQTALLVTNALGMALSRQDTASGSDHPLRPGRSVRILGFSQKVTRRRPRAIRSGAVGAPFDNAMVETFWARMQVELLNRRRWKTRIELATAIHDYIELLHNTRRRHSALDMLTPTEFENNHHHQPPPPDSRSPTPSNPGQSRSPKPRMAHFRFTIGLCPATGCVVLHFLPLRVDGRPIFLLSDFPHERDAGLP